MSLKAEWILDDIPCLLWQALCRAERGNVDRVALTSTMSSRGVDVLRKERYSRMCFFLVERHLSMRSLDDLVYENGD